MKTTATELSLMPRGREKAHKMKDLQIDSYRMHIQPPMVSHEKAHTR